MMNYFEVLKLSRDEIEGKDDATIKTLVENAHRPLYDAALKYTGFGAGDRRDLLNEAKNTLIDPQRRKKYLEALDNLRQAEFINFINLFKATSSTITAEQHSRLLQQARDNYGLTAGEVEKILKDSGLIVEKANSIFKFPNGDEATSIPQLATLMAKNAREAVEALYQGNLEQSLRRFGEKHFANAARAVVHQYPRNRQTGLLAMVAILRSKVVFRQGSEAGTPQQLARLIDQNWEQSKTLLYNGFIALWLEYTKQPQLATTAKSITTRNRSEQDIGLEELVQKLDPQIGKPELQGAPSRIDFGRMDTQSQKTIDIQITNVGRGFLHGNVQLPTDMLGLQVSDTEIRGEGVVSVELDARHLTPNKTYQAALVFNTNGGMVRVPISCDIIPKATNVYVKIKNRLAQRINYFEVLELSIEELQGKDEATIQSLVNAAHKRLYALPVGAYANIPRPDGQTQAQWQEILNEAKAALIDPQKREQHIKEVEGDERQASDPETVVDGVTHNLGFIVLNQQGEAYVQVIIPKMTPVPCEIVDEFRTVEDSQTSVQIELIQGLEQDQREDEFIKFEDYKLGECIFQLPSGLPKASPIHVTYKYNLDQTLEITAEGPDGRTANVTIQRPTLDEAEIAEATDVLADNVVGIDTANVTIQRPTLDEAEIAEVTDVLAGKVVGIDLGMTYSAIAYVNEDGEPEIIPNAENERTTPSVIMFEDDHVIVGKIAKQQANAVLEQIVEFVGREMGKSKEEFSRTFNGWDYSAEELSALILKKLKQDAEAYLGTEITDAVITVPAYFKDAERHATRLAGEIAGLNVLQVINEPTAAALAYGVDLHGSDQTVFVFDLGGGTFDVTVMKVSGSELTMIATNGDHRLGGKDWDDKIITYVAKVFEDEHGENPLQDLHAYQDIQLNAISAKESLSRRQQARIVCNYNGKGSRVELTREKFEELTADLVDRCSSLCDIVLSEAGMTWENIDVVLLVGGSTRLPMVQEMITKISGKAINPQEVNPDEVVALGAAIWGTLISFQSFRPR